MPNPIAHFDIRADDLARTRRFYERVFGWTFEAWGPPDFFLIWTGAPHEPGAVHGSLSKRWEPRAGAEGIDRHAQQSQRRRGAPEQVHAFR